ncbi:HEAT repeat domain-containing protein [bacterium]|nr:HEAT repeat domain-containing protein [bacterium]
MRRFNFLILSNFIFLFLLLHIASAQQEEVNIKRVKLVLSQDYGKAKEIYLPFKDVVYRFLKRANIEILPENAEDYEAILEIKVEGKPLWGYYDKRGELLFTPFTNLEAKMKRGFCLEENDETEYWPKFYGWGYPWIREPILLPRSIEEPSNLNPEQEFDILYTGAMLRGSIIFRGKDGKTVSESFEGLWLPGKFSNFYDPPYKPHQAPFLQAFLDRGSFPDKFAIAVGKFLGINALIPALADEDWKVRKSTYNALAEFAPSAAELLISALKSEDQMVRMDVVILLGIAKDKKAVEHLIPLLKDKDASIRSSAAFSLGEIGDERAIPPLMEALNDPSADVRIAAIRSLGALKASESVDILIEIAKNEGERKDVRRRAIESLGEIGGKKATDFLVDLTRKSREQQREIDNFYLTALQALVNTRDPRAVEFLVADFKEGRFYSDLTKYFSKLGAPAVDALISLLNERKYPNFMKGSIALTLGKLKDARAVDALIASLEESDPTYLAQVEYALYNIGKPATNSLLAVLKGDNPERKIVAIKVLANLKAQEALEPLLLIAQNQREDVEVRSQAAFALRQFPSQRVKDVLLSILKDDKEKNEVRISALRAFEEMGAEYPPEVVEMALERDMDYFLREVLIFSLVGKKSESIKEKLLTLIRSPKVNEYIKTKCISTLALVWREEIADDLVSLMNNDPSLEKPIAIALSQLRDERAIPHLVSLLNKRAGAIDIELLNALRRYKSPSAIPFFEELCKSSDPEVRRLGAEGLGEIGLTASLDILLKLLNDEYPIVRRAAAIALGKIGSFKATEALIETLKDSYAIVREGAARALGDIGDKRAIDALVPLLNDRNKEVKEAAIISLGKLQDPRSVPLIIQILEQLEKKHIERAYDLTRSAYNALVRLGPLAVEPLINVLKSENSSYEQKGLALSALAEIQDPRAIEPILSLFEEIHSLGLIRSPEGLGDWQLLNALRSLTHQDLGYNVSLWREWWENNKSFFLKGGR